MIAAVYDASGVAPPGPEEGLMMILKVTVGFEAIDVNKTSQAPAAGYMYIGTRIAVALSPDNVPITVVFEATVVPFVIAVVEI